MKTKFVKKTLISVIGITVASFSALANSGKQAESKARDLVIADALVSTLLKASAAEIKLTRQKCKLSEDYSQVTADDFNRNQTVSGTVIMKQNCSIPDDAGGNNTEIQILLVSDQVYIEKVQINRSGYL